MGLVRPLYITSFPAKVYLLVFTPSFPPRAVDPETIRNRAVTEREKVEQSLAKLVAREMQSVREGEERAGERGGRERRDEMWWETWREMGCDVERGVGEVWPVGKMRRRVTGSM